MTMKALSVRQPWAWLIVNGFKDIENRTWWTKFRGPVLIHASKGMTVEEYEDAKEFAYCVDENISIPPIPMLARGGIVGRAEIVDCVTGSTSPWFCGEYGLVLRCQQVHPFRPCRGALGFFDVEGYQ